MDCGAWLCVVFCAGGDEGGFCAVGDLVESVSLGRRMLEGGDTFVAAVPVRKKMTSSEKGVPHGWKACIAAVRMAAAMPL